MQLLHLAICIACWSIAVHVTPVSCAQPMVMVQKDLMSQDIATDMEPVPEEKTKAKRLLNAPTQGVMKFFAGEQDVEGHQTKTEKFRVQKHPFWDFEGSQLGNAMVILCCVVLFLAGVLCSAGGIGGGGIYVTVLMVCGQLSVHDAVPLSKAIVFMGSIITLIMNAGKAFTAVASGKQGDDVKLAKTVPLIDYNICRLVVPCCLIGSYFGVLLNRNLPAWLILGLLAGVLLFISLQVGQQTYKQWKEERQLLSDSAEPDQHIGSAPSSSPDPIDIDNPTEDDLKQKLGHLHYGLFIFMLLIVVICAVLRFHSGECMKVPTTGLGVETACNHPSVFWLGQGTLQTLMHSSSADAIRNLSFIIPLIICLASALYFNVLTFKFGGWKISNNIKYCSMAMGTGCMAGLVGIGGGLIFSPFFLLMGVEPAIAVATSSTCVIFTSSSTSFQYLFTDRIIVSLAVVYGTMNVMASYCGTRLVHVLQQEFAARKSFISGIVFIGVFISLILSVIKFSQEIASPGKMAH